jgi:hypothetical protein
LDLLERATAFVEQKIAQSSLAKQESYYVSANDIEVGERELMEGLNYEMRCHHPHAAIRVLAKEMSTFLSEACESPQECCSDGSEEGRNPLDEIASPRHVGSFSDEHNWRNLYERSIAVAQHALIFSDVSFLSCPGPLAFAAVAIAARNGRSQLEMPRELLH